MDVLVVGNRPAQGPPPRPGSQAPRPVLPCPWSPRAGARQLETATCPSPSLAPACNPASPKPSALRAAQPGLAVRAALEAPGLPTRAPPASRPPVPPLGPRVAAPPLGSVSDKFSFHGSGLHVCHCTYLTKHILGANAKMAGVAFGNLAGGLGCNHSCLVHHGGAAVG